MENILPAVRGSSLATVRCFSIFLSLSAKFWWWALVETSLGSSEEESPNPALLTTTPYTQQAINSPFSNKGITSKFAPTPGFFCFSCAFYQALNNRRLMNNYKASFLLPCNSKKGRASFWNIMLEKQRRALTVKSLMFPLHLKAFQFTYKL